MSCRARVCCALALALPLLAGAAACGSHAKPAADRSPSKRPKASGVVTVFAAASLTESFNDEKATLSTANPSLSIRYNFAGSGALVTQIEQGAPADVIATADTESMKKLTDAGLVEAPTVFARNKLEILVARGNPKGIKQLADLARTDVKVVLEDDSVPAGKYAARALHASDVSVHPVSREADVKSAVAKVTTGEADATVVYVSDVQAAGRKGTGVEIPPRQNVTAEYPIAIVKGTSHHGAAEAFLDAIVKGTGQAALESHGFLPAR